MDHRQWFTWCHPFCWSSRSSFRGSVDHRQASGYPICWQTGFCHRWSFRHRQPWQHQNGWTSCCGHRRGFHHRSKSLHPFNRASCHCHWWRFHWRKAGDHPSSRPTRIGIWWGRCFWSTGSYPFGGASCFRHRRGQRHRQARIHPIYRQTMHSVRSGACQRCPRLWSKHRTSWHGHRGSFSSRPAWVLPVGGPSRGNQRWCGRSGQQRAFTDGWAALQCHGGGHGSWFTWVLSIFRETSHYHGGGCPSPWVHQNGGSFLFGHHSHRDDRSGQYRGGLRSTVEHQIAL